MIYYYKINCKIIIAQKESHLADSHRAFSLSGSNSNKNKLGSAVCNSLIGTLIELKSLTFVRSF